jgi:hypothetical protein
MARMRPCQNYMLSRITGTIASDRYGDFENELTTQANDFSGRDCCLTLCIIELALCATTGQLH